MISSHALLPVIQEEVRTSGPLTFFRFMELCLYHPRLGYYNTERAKLGASGDFYTSTHVSPVFARLLGRHLERAWEALGQPAGFDLVELGAGDGLLGSELLPWLRQRFPDLFSCLRYTAVEQSAVLRNLLQDRLHAYRDRLQVMETLAPGTSASAAESQFQGCVFANEFFDALPIHQLVWRDGGWRERCMGLVGEKRAWVESNPSSDKLVEQAERRFDPALSPNERENGWVAEISPQAGPWMQAVGRRLGRGELLIIDYGYTLEEWQQGRFPQGSALGYRQHQVCYDLLSHPGEQDLTAHVHFTQLIQAGEQAGFRLRSLQSQAKFLMELGEPDEFADLFADCASEAERLRRAQLLKTLILPQGMGESFRVLLLERKASGSASQPAPQRPSG